MTSPRIVPGQDSPGLVYSSISGRSASFSEAAEKIREAGGALRHFNAQDSGRAEAEDKRLGDRPHLRGRAVVYVKDVQVSRSLAVKRRGEGKRGVIKELSDKSRRRLALVARNVEGLTWLITLTYPDDFKAALRKPSDSDPAVMVPAGRVLKQHMAALRHRLTRRGIGGLWFVEFMDKGAPHVHILVNGPIPFADVGGFRVKGQLQLSAWWYEIVGSGDPKHLSAGTRMEKLRLVDGAARYAAKYAAKWQQKVVPEEFEGIGRMWGLFGGVKPHCFELEGKLNGEVAAVHRVVRRLQQARSAGRLRSVHPVTGEIVQGKLRARVRRRMSSAGFFKDAGVHGWTSYGVGPAVAAYVLWRRGARPPGAPPGLSISAYLYVDTQLVQRRKAWLHRHPAKGWF